MFKKNLFSLVVADDYGISECVNKAILAELEKGTVDIVSILPNFTQTEDITQLKKNLPQNKFSIHLNLVRGRPLSPISKVKSLVTKKGEFHSIIPFLFLLALKKINLKEMEYEIENQILIFKKWKIKPIYIDSEQHTHILPPIMYIVSRLSHKHNLTVRSPRSSFYYLKNKLVRLTILVLFYKIVSFVYSKNEKKSQTKIYDVHIVHPGANYD